MTNPLIHGTRGFVPASKLLEAIGGSVDAIKKEDGLTWVEMGEALGKSDDQVGKYALSLATMDALTFLRACQVWNGRFANKVFSLLSMTLVDTAASSIGDLRRGLLDITQLLAGLQLAMLDGDLDDNEIEGLDAQIEAAGALVDALRLRLAQIRAAKSAGLAG